MYTLLKNNIIDFDKLLLDKYKALNLDEANTIILIKLNQMLKNNQHFLEVEMLSETMSLSKTEIAKRIVGLVNDGFVNLELSALDQKETFSLDETYKRLSYLLEGVKQNNHNHNLNDKIKQMVQILETEFKKILSPIERETISRWYVEYQYSDECIEEAIIKTLRYKNRSIGYVDRLLRVGNKEQKPEIKGSENIQELFKKAYVHSK
ncbi:MAG: DnaD domain protein [Bacilli bacterium]|nr:DnaD domain protein [Bacilli bacterium]